MANLPSQHPHLSLHLADRSLTPLITSSRSRPQLDALTSLSHTALSAHESALRLGLGSPQRIMVEHTGRGPVLLQSYLRASPSTAPSSSAATTHNNTNTNTTAPTALSSTTISTPTVPGGATTNGATGSPPSSSSSSLTSASAQTPVNEAAGGGAGAGAAAVERRLQQLQLGEPSAALQPAEPEDGAHDDNSGAPMLVGVVVAPGADEARDARRAAARLERVGREVQAWWADVEQQMQGGEEEEGGAAAGDAAGD
ncbi:hypothetical protein F4821DRAFT_230093 [Hypoxylon rubiginosum]|uniref:Uncharacterized protein n=1 Tax=Hypoxylon rubiginosum TaxID=110542 RepID=A0ACC0DAT0_9PEZI|nr:hypothetical protein F4821DRAFT_230093 [Hypoxylon rubiginosum]